MVRTAATPATPNNGLAEILNRDCQCISLDRAALRRELESDAEHAGLYRSIVEERPHLFSTSAVFVSRAHVARMARIVQAVEAVVAMPAYRAHVLAWAPPIARFAPGPLGAFLGYDFHLGTRGPQLIEINTNAGGALLNTVLARAQQACCKEMTQMAVGPVALEDLERVFFDMFVAEWRRQRGAAELRRIAIVDDAPADAYMQPEFVLFQRLFERHGLQAAIVDAASLRHRDGGLWCGDLRIDLVYNRLTDFALAAPAHAALRDAYLAGDAVLTPHPHAHALYADKRNLAALTDSARLRVSGVTEDDIAILAAGIPRTVSVTADNAEALWTERRRLFFKPAAGYGSKAAYRGDKLTRRVWGEILAAEYIAQEFVSPSERRLRVAGAAVALKLDLRNYVYAGKVQFLAARLYRGQTTNFRTPGGGFAAVFTPPASAPCSDIS